ncbi:MAG: hypothetical protein RIM99_03870 [Cyclobacteriaceae bacterium]
MIYLIIIAALALIGIGGYNYLSGKKLIKDLTHFYSLKRKSIKTLDSKWSSAKDRSDIIVSFTTIPERIDSIELTVKSLLHQKRLPKRIHLNIPYTSFRNQKEYEIPEWLEKLASVNIVRLDEDYGPASKFIPSLEFLENDQKILVVDDDNIYPPGYIDEFERAGQKNPDFILAASGWRVPEDLIDKSTTLKSNIFKIPPTPVPGTRISKLYWTDIIQGYSGYLLKPRFFKISELKDYSDTPKQVRFVDDVWISAHAQVPKYIFPMKRFCYTPFFSNDFFKASSLAKINNYDRQDNADRNNSVALRFFKNKWPVSKN